MLLGQKRRVLRPMFGEPLSVSIPTVRFTAIFEPRYSLKDIHFGHIGLFSHGQESYQTRVLNIGKTRCRDELKKHGGVWHHIHGMLYGRLCQAVYHLQTHYLQKKNAIIVR